jgi:NADH-quinone oxidoreductase subunit J
MLPRASTDDMTPFLVIAVVTLLTAIAAISLRNLVHCALFAALTFAGLAALFLRLNAQFVGLAQVLVYVGAVAILIVFAILLTRGSEVTPERLLSRSWWAGAAVAALVLLCLATSILRSPLPDSANHPNPDVRSDVVVRKIGTELMSQYVLPLEIVALLLTAATIGAVIIALNEKEEG